MKRVMTVAGVFLLMAACGSFGTGEDQAPKAGTDAALADAALGDAVGVPPLESGAPPDGSSDAAEPLCSADALICESFDDGYDDAWITPSADLPSTTGSAGGRTGVLLSQVSDDTYEYKGARIKQGFDVKKPIQIDFDMRVEAPDTTPGGASPNFQVLYLSTNELDLVFYLYPTGKVEVITGTKPGGTLTNHALTDAHVDFQEWAHYTLTVNLAASGSFELYQRSTLLAKGSFVAPTSNAELNVGVARNNNRYDLRAEYDNVVIRPGS